MSSIPDDFIEPYPAHLDWPTSASEPAFVYHYTNTTGLMKIIELRSLWATDVWYLNDSGEATYGIGIAKDTISKYPQGGTSIDGVFNTITEQAVQGWASVSIVDNYIACLSEKGDQLSQWRAYGGVRGFSIGFDFAALKAFLNSQPLTQLRKVIYDADRQRSLVADLFTKARLGLVNEKNITAAGKNFLVGLTMLAPILKHPGFEEEAEVRIHTWRADQKPSSDVSFRDSIMGITPYITVPLCASGESRISTIRKIIIGPQSHSREVERAITKFLHTHDLGDVEVSHSAVPLRA